MSVQVMAWVLADAPQDLKPAEMLVAISLANHASSDGGHAYPSVQVLMSETRLSRRSVQTSLRSLEERGVIQVEREATRRLPAMYAFCAFRGANPATSEKVEAQRLPDDAQIVLVEAQILPIRGAEIAPKPSERTVRESSDEPSDTPLPPKPFDLWMAFCAATDRDYRQATTKAKEMALRDARGLVADGITPDDVSRCVKYMQSESWRKGIITFGQMVNAIGVWRMDGKPEVEKSRASPNGKPPSFEDEMAAVRARRAQPDPDPAIETTWRTR